MDVEEEVIEGDERETTRKLPWLADIFFYPASIPGLTILVIYVFTPVVLYLLGLGFHLAFGDFGFFSMPLVLAFAIVDLIVTAYICWYFATCINESALGKVRAPETLNKNNTEDTFEMILELLRIAFCVFICVGPVLTYYSLTSCFDWVFWLLLACGVFFFPMSLLATVMFGSLAGLNPILIIASIFSTFFRYCLVLLAFGMPIGIAVAISTCLPKDAVGIVGYILQGVNTILTFATGLPISMPEYTIGIVSFLLRGCYAYLALVVAHILGRFYYCNRERLYWEV